MEEKENGVIYAIPANYTDSGKLLGGMLSPRNAIETIILLALIGYLEFSLIPVSGTIHIIVMSITLIPLAVVCVMGVDGDSLLQYLGHILHYLFRRRKLHYKMTEAEDHG